MTNGTITVRNSYNPDGARIAKIVNRSNGSETHRYTYNGGKLVYDIIRINKEGVISNLTILMSYDESGRPFMITYANVSYYYLLNAQGDVVGIMNVSGDIMVEYTYDAWGNVLSITGPMADTMGQHNQLRYRGYVYDPETNLYFLNSRFYNPETGRFINSDIFAATGQGLLGNNMYAYCGNNPVIRTDANGCFWDIVFDIVSLVVSVIEVINDPTDAGAWLGLACDVVDVVVPCVGGLGEAARAVDKAIDVADAVDDIHDAGKAVENTVEATTHLHRPYIRKSTREAVEKAAKRAPDGSFLDANTGKVITGKYDLGHEYGHEFWRERQRAESLGWTQKQFNDYMNNPAFYRIEDPFLNRSHKFEMR